MRFFDGLRPMSFRASAPFFLICLALTACPNGNGGGGGGGLHAPGDIGSPCEGGDCLEGLTCFGGVPGGYCTVDCEAGCPEGSRCASMGGMEFCLFECSSDGDCRDDYGCGGGVCRPGCESRQDCAAMENCQDGVCMADGIGAPCGHPSDCQQGNMCFVSLPGGYCTMDCAEDACPDGTTCWTYGGASYCYDDCVQDSDCRSGYVCNAGVCNVPCSDHAECPGGYVCRSNRCQGSGIGETCTSGVDCADGLSCHRGVDSGYCTVRCGGSGECPLGSVCGPMNGEMWCLAACRSDLDCESGQSCYDGGCAPPCTSDADCVEGFCDTATGRCRGGDLEYLDFGQVSPGQTIEFEVDAKVHAFSVLAHGHPSVTYYSQSVVNPNGTNIIGSHWFGPPLRIYPMQEAFTMQVPNSDSPSVDAIPGTWRVRLDAYGSSAPARVQVLLRRTPNGLDRDGGLALEVFLAPGAITGVNAANADRSTTVQGIFSRFQLFFGHFAGLSIDSIDFHDLPSSYSDIRNEGHYHEMFRTFSKDDALNLFLVRSVTLGGESSVAGVAGGIPGPPRLAGTQNSGALLEGDMGHWRYTGDGISHEAGHYMGLFHVSEFDGRTHDLISDTPTCADINNCPDGWKNLMFPALTGQMDNITPGQALVVRAFGGVD